MWVTLETKDSSQGHPIRASQIKLCNYNSWSHARDSLKDDRKLQIWSWRQFVENLSGHECEKIPWIRLIKSFSLKTVSHQSASPRTRSLCDAEWLKRGLLYWDHSITQRTSTMNNSTTQWGLDIPYISSGDITWPQKNVIWNKNRPLSVNEPSCLNLMKLSQGRRR